MESNCCSEKYEGKLGKQGKETEILEEEKGLGVGETDWGGEGTLLKSELYIYVYLTSQNLWEEGIIISIL